MEQVFTINELILKTSLQSFPNADNDKEEAENDIPASVETKTYNSGKGKTTISMSFSKERGGEKSSRCDQSRRLDIRKPYLGPYPRRRQTDRDDPGGYREMADVCCTAHRRKRYHHLCTWTGSFRLARLHDGQ